jgi:hypothetical protein
MMGSMQKAIVALTASQTKEVVTVKMIKADKIKKCEVQDESCIVSAKKEAQKRQLLKNVTAWRNFRKEMTALKKHNH